MLDIPIPGQLSPTGSFSYGRLLEINKCEKGIWAAVKHFFGRNVYLVVDIDNKIERLYVPLEEVKRKIDINSCPGRVGKTFAEAVLRKSPRINIREITNRIQNFDYFTFYKESKTLLTAFLGNYYVLENKRRIFGCITAEGAFLSKKYAAILPKENPFSNATEYTEPSLSELNKQYDEIMKKHLQYNDWKANWITKKGNIQAMREVLAEKFKEGTPEAQGLLATREADLIEETDKTGKDTFWATDPGGRGVNMLGQLLMKRRAELLKSAVTPLIREEFQEWIHPVNTTV